MNIENNSLNSELIIYRYNKKENTENVLESLKTLNEQKNKIIYNDKQKLAVNLFHKFQKI